MLMQTTFWAWQRRSFAQTLCSCTCGTRIRCSLGEGRVYSCQASELVFAGFLNPTIRVCLLWKIWREIPGEPSSIWLRVIAMMWERNQDVHHLVMHEWHAEDGCQQLCM